MTRTHGRRRGCFKPPVMMMDVTWFWSGFSGAVAALLLLISFTTDYWLLGTETCTSKDTAPVIYHEGLLWRCVVKGTGEDDSFWTFWGIQSTTEICSHAYLFPTPIYDTAITATPATSNASATDAAEVYRGLWIMFISMGISAVLLAGFLGIGAGTSGKASLCKAAGGLFLTGGLLTLCVLVLHVVWFYGTATLEDYAVQQRRWACMSFHLSVRHGPSFMLAPVGVFFSLLSGSLHLALERRLRKQQIGSLIIAEIEDFED
ncbi:transmembrane protein 182-like [Engraulis encrasicolus]|uniref:transmembrane protein 182-like n=1 Tax=Engraulis encrasicolus TaxID=184585 RepID=UPI002FD020A1